MINTYHKNNIIYCPQWVDIKTMSYANAPKLPPTLYVNLQVYSWYYDSLDIMCQDIEKLYKLSPVHWKIKLNQCLCLGIYNTQMMEAKIKLYYKILGI